MKVEIKKLDNFGRGITFINDKICFVENTLTGEIVEIKIINETKKYLEAIPVSFIKKSNIRIEEECPYSTICGGCHLNHICFNEENQFKEKKVREVLKKYGTIPENKIKNIIYHDRNHYRNKITLHGKDGKLGLYKKKTHEIIPINKCLQVNPKINEMIKLLNQNNKNIKEAIIKTSNDNSQVLISIKGEILDKEKINNQCDVFILNGIIITKEKHLLTSIGTKKYYESEKSFFQVNNTLTKDLYDEVLNHVKEKEYQTVLDLYCGTGTIGIYIHEYINKGIGIDYNPSNIEDANQNKKLNRCNNIEFICDKVENRIHEFQNIDLIIVDPPRSGLDPKTVDYLNLIKPNTIIYISCDPITLARDLKDLQKEYNIKEIKPFNMFPRTYHVESISVLERKNVEK